MPTFRLCSKTILNSAYYQRGLRFANLACSSWYCLDSVSKWKFGKSTVLYNIDTAQICAIVIGFIGGKQKLFFPFSIFNNHVQHFFKFQVNLFLTILWRRSLSHRSQSIDMLSKSNDWFLYGRDFHHERVKVRLYVTTSSVSYNVCKTLRFWISLLKHSICFSLSPSNWLLHPCISLFQISVKFWYFHNKTYYFESLTHSFPMHPLFT